MDILSYKLKAEVIRLSKIKTEAAHRQPIFKMPRLKQVKKLYEICIISFNKAIVNHIDELSLDNETIEIESRSNLLANVNPIINESLLNNIDEQILQNESQKLMLIMFYRSNYLKEFNLKFKLPNTEGFYEEYLKGLSKLVVLNLTKVCTDEILKIVGDNCPLLEVIYIISKTESVSNKSRRNLNALKLKFFVSDEGLEQLHKCKNLKKIYMDKIIRSSCGGRKITHKGLKSLLSALPKIRYISYEDMGRVLEEWDDENGMLNLIHIHDNHITPNHIKIFNNLCPSLQTLCLAIPTVVQDPDVSRDCLQQLSQSDLSIRNLVLRSFSFDYSLEDFLNSKGDHLRTLSLEHDLSITTQSLLAIGMKCRNLEHLAIKLLHPSNSDYEILQTINFHKCFVKLKTLKLFGLNWKPNIIFPLCLYNAQQIESIVLYNKYYTEPIDEVFEILPTKNLLSNLTKLCLLDGFSLSTKTIVNFVLGCKKLEEITFKSGSGYNQIFEDLIQEKNFDLTVKADSIGSYGYCLCQN